MWTPLESNPDVMNKMLHSLGVPEKWQIVDVLSLDPDMLGLIPQPAIAFILLFPTSPKYEELKNKQEEELKAKGQKITENVFFVKQYISNACGTMALLHSVANNLDSISLGDGVLKAFIDKTKDMDPEARGKALLERDDFAETHNAIAKEGQTEVPSEENPVIHHFVAFIHSDGDLYELDGRKAFPVNHGPTTPESLVEDAANVMRDIMKQDPDEMGFTVCALVSSAA